MENTHLRIKDLPNSERPYEKLEQYGADKLTEAELLAIIIRTGNKNETSVSLAQRVLTKEKELEQVIDLSLKQLMSIKGIGRVKAIQIKAAFEMGKRITRIQKGNKVSIKTPSDVADIVMEEMRFLKREYVKAMLLNTKNNIIKTIDISIGNLNSSIIHPREVFSEAIKSGAASIILVHNHPSGDPEPSKEDVSITKKIFESGKILGIELLDHIVIGDNKFVSLKEKNFF